MFRLRLGIALAIAICAPTGWAQKAPATAGPYKILKTAKVGGDGGFDYVNVDVENRRLYIARTGKTPRINVYNLDTLEPVGEVMTTNAHGVVIDPKTSHGFATTKPITMFDTKTLATIKPIEVQGNPDGALFDASNQRAYILGHSSPHVTVIDTKEGSIVKAFDIGGMAEQAAADGQGHLYIDVEDKDNIAVVDTKTLDVTAHYDVAGKGGTCAGLAMDAKNRILFAACRNPANMVILNADDGKIISTLPIGMGTDGATFNPNTMEAFSSQGADGTLTVIKENSPTSFVVEQTLPTMNGAKTSALDTKTNRIILIAAEFGPPTPPAQPGGRAGRGTVVPDSFSILVVGR
jgi:DNA-binding beta-propeller fold protein YncE